jgi:hypothetical protein
MFLGGEMEGLRILWIKLTVDEDSLLIDFYDKKNIPYAWLPNVVYSHQTLLRGFNTLALICSR